MPPEALGYCLVSQLAAAAVAEAELQTWPSFVPV
jgi:hypothetical protein